MTIVRVGKRDDLIAFGPYFESTREELTSWRVGFHVF
jgi:hypothetical protein